MVGTSRAGLPDTGTVARGEGGLPHRLQTHIAPLDGLRGWAALMVVIGHFGFFGTIAPAHRQLGTYGVFLFFALSGFLMGHLYLSKPISRQATATYLVARISRVVPLYYATVLGGYMIGRYIDPNFNYAMDTATLARHFVFLGSVPPFWSIAPEIQFYFLFPVLWWIVTRPAETRMRYAIPAAIFAIVIFFFRGHFPGIIVFSKMHIFLAGITVAVIRPYIIARLDTRTAIIAQIFALIVLAVLLLPTSITGELIYPSGGASDIKMNRYYGDLGRLLPFAFVILAFTFETKLANLIFANRLMRLTGKFSFSLYLLHSPVMYVFEKYGVFEYFSYWSAIGITMVVLYLVSTVSFYLLEEPSRVVVRRTLLRIFAQFDGRSKVPASAGA